MNFLFATVLVLLIVAPGLTFFRAYHSGAFSHRYSRLTISDQIFRSIVPGITAQAIAILINNLCSDTHPVDLNTIGLLLIGPKDDNVVKECFKVIEESLWRILIYHLSMILTGALLGWGSRELVRWLKLDRKWKWFRYDNKWFYLLKGEVVEFKDGEDIFGISNAELIRFVIVDILTKVEGGNVIYTGALYDFDLEQDGGLKTLHLRAAQRKFVKIATVVPKPSRVLLENEISTTDEDEKDDYLAEELESEYHEIPGKLLSIPYSQIINMNITYYVVEQEVSTTETIVNPSDIKAI
ncbi:hypothetical protein [Siphonobacter sp. SORGH_AS_1065]|uniref:hypothetical protein n=1 Tax=Siphonobacter sp. SORGH_AS_1065 TaxID=3041795 RepID=UPI0027845C7C|nr:hypothetical protein [Siphonobacter sp. SORGH_AS_1065]MDQ1089029.1 hypothetical protein [Siphonobacter sp. SORGH_AS_1065]